MRPENLREVNIECAMIPPRKSVAHDPAFLEAMPYAKPIVDVLDGAKYVGYVNTDILKEAITEQFVDMVLNGTPASEAVVAINEAMAANA
jgi:ABC-type glycerol-3-phosphate transport system substrate-binding protein